MRRITLASLVICSICMTSIGCTQKSTSTETEKIKTPGGSTTIKTETQVEKTGDHKDK
jgi:hypothetical protein